MTPKECFILGGLFFLFFFFKYYFLHLKKKKSYLGWTEKAPLAQSQQWLLTEINKAVVAQHKNKAESPDSVSALVGFQMQN